MGALPVGVRAGNARAEGAPRGGWFVGHFLPPGDPRASAAVEIKWGTHPRGERRADWAVNEHATTLSVLVRGRFRLYLPGAEVLLAREGDYLLWPPNVPHHWQAEADSIVLTVRWPSRPADSQAVPPPGAAESVTPAPATAEDA